MARIDGDEIDALARLARLSFEPHERTVLATELASIVAYLDAIAAARVDAVSPWTPPRPPDAAPPALRADVVGEVLSREDVLAGVAVSADGLVVVPRFVES